MHYIQLTASLVNNMTMWSTWEAENFPTTEHNITNTKKIWKRVFSHGKPFDRMVISLFL